MKLELMFILTREWGPVMVYVFPEPVCPKANTVQEYLTTKTDNTLLFYHSTGLCDKIMTCNCKHVQFLFQYIQFSYITHQSCLSPLDGNVNESGHVTLRKHVFLGTVWTQDHVDSKYPLLSQHSHLRGEK